MNLLVFQHIACEHPGIFRQFMREQGIHWITVELDQGHQIPDLSAFDALLVMGGPMDVWETDEHPWLVAEKQAIAKWVGQGKPYLGLCLGHQLLADALGATCSRLEKPEIGILDIDLTEDGKKDPFFYGIPTTSKALQWHSVEVSSLPTRARLLASSAACECQAIKVNSNAYSIQYHQEIEADTITNWGQVPAYAQALENVLGTGALDAFELDALPHYQDIATNARQLFDNFLNIARQ